MPIVWLCVCVYVCVRRHLFITCVLQNIRALVAYTPRWQVQPKRKVIACTLAFVAPLFSLPLPASCKWQTSAGHKRQTNWNGKWEAVCSCCNCSWSCRTCACVCACTEICHLPSPVVSFAATFSGNHRFALIRSFICSTYLPPSPFRTYLSQANQLKAARHKRIARMPRASFA